MTTSPLLFLDASPALIETVTGIVLDKMVSALAASPVDLTKPDAVAQQLAQLGHSSSEIAALMDDATSLASLRRKTFLN